MRLYIGNISLFTKRTPEPEQKLTMVVKSASKNVFGKCQITEISICQTDIFH